MTNKWHGVDDSAMRRAEADYHEDMIEAAKDEWNLANYWTPWFNGGHWVHYGIPGTPSESVLMVTWHEDAGFNY